MLDFDGTLAPLAAHPSLAHMDPESEAALTALVKCSNVNLAIISGRAADDVREKVKLENVTYAGNHGFEIIFPNKSRYTHDIDEESRKKFDKLVTELETSVSQSDFYFYSFRPPDLFVRNYLYRKGNNKNIFVLITVVR